MPVNAAERSLRLFAREVMPKIATLLIGAFAKEPSPHRRSTPTSNACSPWPTRLSERHAFTLAQLYREGVAVVVALSLACSISLVLRSAVIGKCAGCCMQLSITSQLVPSAIAKEIMRPVATVRIVTS